MNNKLCALSAAALLSLSALFTGCGGSNSADKPTASTMTNKDKDSAVIYMGTRSEPKMGFDPLKGYGNTDGHSIFQNCLLQLNGDLTFEKEIAKDDTISDDGLTYTFTLRDVKCSDGEPFTAEDVKFTFEEAAKKAFVGN